MKKIIKKGAGLMNGLVLGLCAAWGLTILLKTDVYSLIREEKLEPIISIIIWITGAYFMRLLRTYIIVWDKSSESTAQFLKVYAKTALVNLIIPYILGEVYRMYCYSSILEKRHLGILAVLVDRFFDSIPLVILLAGGVIMNGNTLNGVAELVIFFYYFNRCSILSVSNVLLVF